MSIIAFYYRVEVNNSVLYRIMHELRGLLKNNDRARSARSLFLRRPRSSCIIQFNAYFHCFRKGGYYFKNNDLQFHLIERNNDLLLTVVVAY